MAKYGPMKHPNKAGLDEIGETYNGESIDKGPHYMPDPTGARTGNGTGPQLSETIERVCLDTESVLNIVSMDSGTILNMIPSLIINYCIIGYRHRVIFKEK